MGFTNEASYAWSQEFGGPGLTVRLFRKELELQEAPTEARILVTADSRYVLFVNGHRIGRGPLKGMPDHYFYETYDIAPWLVAGTNVVAAEVRWFGIDGQTSEVHTGRPGFLLECARIPELNTPTGWRVIEDESIAPDRTSYVGNSVNFLKHMEIVTFAKRRGEWKQAGYRDTAWSEAVGYGAAVGGVRWGVEEIRRLVPREIDHLVEEPRRFVRAYCDRTETTNPFEDGGWTVRPGEAATLILDAGALTTGFPEVTIEGGEGREIAITYAECMWTIEDGVPVKRVRDDLEHGVIVGYRDTLRADGRPHAWESFHWRTFRFVQIEVTAGPTDLSIRDFAYRYTTYPAPLAAEFESSDPLDATLFDMCFRTLRLCSHETLEDCPYFEQLHYLGDARIEALVHLATTGDTAYVKRSIRLFRDSVRSDGLVESRVPSQEPQIIPYFALIWILMLDDLYEWTGREHADFLRECLPVADMVLGYFRARRRADGFVGEVDHWNMVDHVPTWDAGEPPAVLEGGSTYLTALWVHAMRLVSRLHREIGDPLDAPRWETLAEITGVAIRDLAFDVTRGCFLEGPGRSDHLSMHSQFVPVLAGIPTAEQSVALGSTLRSALTEAQDDSGTFYRSKLMQSFYLVRALEKLGLYDGFRSSVIRPWHEMIDAHLTTCTEYWPCRSDCHAWSAWPAYEFLTRNLGIRPELPGFQAIRVEPFVDDLTHAEGRMSTPRGPVAVRWQTSDGTLSIDVSAPDGVPLFVKLPGEEVVQTTSSFSRSVAYHRA